MVVFNILRGEQTDSLPSKFWGDMMKGYEKILEILQEHGEMSVDQAVNIIKNKGILTNSKAIRNRLKRMESEELIEITTNFRVRIR